MNDLLVAASAALGQPLSWAGEPLRGSDRAVVRRARASDRSVVVKAYVPEHSGEGFVREAAALRLLAGRGAPALDLLADRSDPPLIVTADLGSGPSLADALLGRDREVAEEAILDLADAVAAVHRVSAGATTEYGAQLAALGGELPLDVDPTQSEIDYGIGQLRERLPELGVALTDAAVAELRGAPERLRAGPLGLSPGDTCPDNNVRTTDGLVLVDFEGASVRPVAWDAAYLLAPWPTCWCCWALPSEVAAAGLARWRDGVREAFPDIDSAGFERDLTLAAAVWSVVSSGWFLRNALGADPPPEDPRLYGLVPPRRAMIQHRLAAALARDRTDLPALAELAEEMLAATVRVWGQVPLALAPAFR